MKIWQKYQEYLSSGEWHIHTSFTDGKNSVLEYAERAVQLGIPLLAFPEHVRLELQYNFDDFLGEIEIARRKFPQLVILSGCEAKVLPDGTLDCSREILDKVEYRLFAFHSFPDNIETYMFALRKVVNELPVDAWAHPGLFFKKHRSLVLGNDALQSIFEELNKNDILLEENSKYGLPTSDWLEIYFGVTGNKPLVSGGDIHSIYELG
jgi:DNA polymerase (family 10)/putative hydrolase